MMCVGYPKRFSSLEKEHTLNLKKPVGYKSPMQVMIDELQIKPITQNEDMRILRDENIKVIIQNASKCILDVPEIS